MQPTIVHIQTDPKTFADRVQKWLDEQSQTQHSNLTSRIDFMSSWFYRYKVKEQFLEADPPEVEIDVIPVRTWREVKELSRRPYRISKPQFPTDDGNPVSIARVLFFRQGTTELHLAQWQDCGIDREAFIAAVRTQLGVIELEVEQPASAPVAAEPTAGSGGDGEREQEEGKRGPKPLPPETVYEIARNYQKVRAYITQEKFAQQYDISITSLKRYVKQYKKAIRTGEIES